MASPCVICMGQSGKPLAGKRCTASACKIEYSKRMKAAKIVMVELHPGRDGSASSPSTVRPASPRSAAAESLSGFVLWELISVFGQREHDPDTFSPYELRNGPAADREPALSYLVFAHWKEGADDNGRRDPPPHTP